ncbi:MAG: metallophosphoesterase family protein [Desulfovibrionales bacterium]
MLAIFSDVHANLEAFQKVLEDMQEHDVSERIGLGDAIGYGPDPEAVVRLLMSEEIPSVLGNHEMVVKEPARMSWFNPGARESLHWTIAQLSPETKAFIQTRLPRFLLRQGLRFVHGYPPQSTTTYLYALGPDKLTRDMRSMDEDVCFVGHTHELELVCFDGIRAERFPLGRGVLRLEKGKKYLINVGSVGQPRDGDKRAKYVLYDPVQRVLEVRYIAYDNTATYRKMIEKNLPRQYAERLR